MIKLSKKGFALPTVLIISIIMLTILVAVLNQVTSIFAVYGTSYYNDLANDAAISGASYVKKCLHDANGQVNWSDSSPLTSNTTCSGVAINTCSLLYDTNCNFTVNDNITTNFEIKSPSYVSANNFNIIVTGKTNILNSNKTAILKTYVKTIKMSVNLS